MKTALRFDTDENGVASSRSIEHRRLRRFIYIGCAVFLFLTAAALVVLELPNVMENVNLEHRIFPDRISSELMNVPSGPTRSARVRLWLSTHSEEIKDAGRRFAIDPRAIAGLIAYEALLNVHLSQYAGLVLWSGPGKVHYKEFRFSEGSPLSRQVEILGLLPRKTMEQRKSVLRSPRWAALYIAAEMRALANIVQRYTSQDVSCDPGALVTLASAWDVPTATAHFQHIARSGFILAQNFQGNWVDAEDVYLRGALNLRHWSCAATFKRDEHSANG